eukprot:247044_1
MSDLEIYASIAANLEESAWSSVLSQLDKEAFAKIQAALDGLKEVADTPDEEIKQDPQAAIKQLNAKLTKLIKGLKAHRGRFSRMEARISQIEANGVSIGGGGGGSYEAEIGISSSMN